jgi:hypothetical protein
VVAVLARLAVTQLLQVLVLVVLVQALIQLGVQQLQAVKMLVVHFGLLVVVAEFIKTVLLLAEQVVMAAAVVVGQ